MNGSVVRAAGGTVRSLRTWRMRQWPHDPTVAHLIFTDHQTVPTPDDVAAAVDHARSRGARAVRTSALFPAAAEVLLGLDFDPIDHLALLRRPDLSTAELGEPRRTRTLAAWQHRSAAEVDRVAFGPMWGNDAASLREIRGATPEHRARTVVVDRRIVAFAISGAAGDSGYLQRIAVHPTVRRSGVASDLVVDALRWMERRRRSHCLVNTGVDNVAALALYDRLGFERMPDVLTIAERRLTG